jgi:hypothetical protein
MSTKGKLFTEEFHRVVAEYKASGLNFSLDKCVVKKISQKDS